MKSMTTTLTKNSQTINTVIIDGLKDNVPAVSKKNADGSYTISLNGRFSFERLQEEYLHELQHIQDEHHDLDTANEAELEVRKPSQPRYETNLQFEYRVIAPDLALADLVIAYNKWVKDEAAAKHEVDKWIKSMSPKRKRTAAIKDEGAEEWIAEMREKYRFK